MQKRAIFSLFLMICTQTSCVMIYHYSVMDKKMTAILYQIYSHFLVRTTGILAEFTPRFFLDQFIIILYKISLPLVRLRIGIVIVQTMLANGANLRLVLSSQQNDDRNLPFPASGNPSARFPSPHHAKNAPTRGAFLHGADDRNRTCTVTQWILSPSRLPVPPRPLI